MGMYPLIEDAMHKHFDELVASGMTEEQAHERMREEQEEEDARSPY
jgi:hypothetical protein